MSKSSSLFRVLALKLPFQFKQDLSLPQGTLIVHSRGGIIEGLHADVAVGDIVSERHYTEVKVFDYRTKRYEVLNSTRSRKPCIHVINPPGYLSLNSVTLATSMKKGSLCVIGEEDLLVVSFLVQENKTIIYGQPDIGVVLVRSRVETALKALKILKPAVAQYSYEM